MKIDYYFAGALFCHKDLIGNHLLAESILRNSSGKYHAVLPQKEENQLRPSPLEIRDNDFRMLMESQMALFNFDGSELDSGTVVEFMAARFLDLPCVILRTDFRSAGDQNADGENWNLMCSGYPRTEVAAPAAMELYQKCFRDGIPTAEALKDYYDSLAGKILKSFENVIALPSVFRSEEEALRVYTHFVRTCGNSLAAQFPEERLRKLIFRRGLFSAE